MKVDLLETWVICKDMEVISGGCASYDVMGEFWDLVYNDLSYSDKERIVGHEYGSVEIGDFSYTPLEVLEAMGEPEYKIEETIVAIMESDIRTDIPMGGFISTDYSDVYTVRRTVQDMDDRTFWFEGEMQDGTGTAYCDGVKYRVTCEDGEYYAEEYTKYSIYSVRISDIGIPSVVPVLEDGSETEYNNASVKIHPRFILNEYNRGGKVVTTFLEIP